MQLIARGPLRAALFLRNFAQNRLAASVSLYRVQKIAQNFVKVAVTRIEPSFFWAFFVSFYPSPRSGA